MRHFVFYGLLLGGLLTGCQVLIRKPDDVLFHECYVTVDDSAALEFVQEALEVLDEEHGGPRLPVETVHLRVSQRNATGRQYRLAEKFSKTELVAPGEIAIYIAVPPGYEEFYPMLGHECGHLLDPTVIDDWDMEGFCMVFSEKICKRTGRSWEAWRRRYPRDSADPYAKAYWQARDARLSCE
jgi:hypothetical protein